VSNEMMNDSINFTLDKIIKPGKFILKGGINFSLDNISSRTVLSESNHMQILEVEERSFWYKHRRDIVCKVVENFSKKGSLIFDIGGANGFFSKALEGLGFTCVLFEPGGGGVFNAKKRGLKHIYNGFCNKETVNTGAIPNIILLDVLEHIENDISFLTEVYQLLSYDGLLYLTVPAYQWLMTNEERLSGHYRRYNRKDIIAKLMTTGFSIEYFTYFFWFLPLPIFLIRKVLRIKKTKNIDNYKKQHILPLFLEKIILFMLSNELKKIAKGGFNNGGGGGVF
jgi:2-polyprenyl-3-methyl-5-hydroxy-6-metoxy-1,4-benzoquinol methylase